LKNQLGVSCTDLVKYLEISQPGVEYAVKTGEKIAKKHNHNFPLTG